MHRALGSSAAGQPAVRASTLHYPVPTAVPAHSAVAPRVTTCRRARMDEPDRTNDIPTLINGQDYAAVICSVLPMTCGYLTDLGAAV